MTGMSSAQHAGVHDVSAAGTQAGVTLCWRRQDLHRRTYA